MKQLSRDARKKFEELRDEEERIHQALIDDTWDKSVEEYWKRKAEIRNKRRDLLDQYGLEEREVPMPHFVDESQQEAWNAQAMSEDTES